MESDRPSADALDGAVRLARLRARMFGRLAPVTIGDFRVLRRIGSGGIGLVFAAWDPALDRTVAIKVLRDPWSSPAALRLRREAVALARLRHPNVVSVHAVGEHEGRVYLAMEYVEGCTLREWIRRWRDAPRRDLDALLDVFVQVANGLAAAHAAGLVHRDVKPDNVMVDDADRAYVMDFGLARTVAVGEPSSERGSTADADADERAAPTPDVGPSAPADPAAAPHEPATPPTTAGSRDATPDMQAATTNPPRDRARAGSTETGLAMGTPGYMAPEQYAGGTIDAKTDQFGLCVTLWEALYGERPFAGGGVTELAAVVTRGERRPPPKGHDVPRWLQQVLERGLSVDPSARFESLPAFAAAVRRGQTRTRRVRRYAAAAVLALAAAGTFGWRRAERARAIDDCEAEGAAIAAAWNDDVAARVRAALSRGELPDGAAIADRLIPRMDTYADAWASARTEACRQAEVDGHWDDQTLARARWCLDQRRGILDWAPAALQEQPTPPLVQAVLGTVASHGPQMCTDPDALASRPAPPAAQRDAVAELYGRLDDVQVVSLLGSGPRVVERARENLESARALGWAPAVAHAQMRLGQVLLSGGETEEAATVLQASYFTAVRAGSPNTAGDAASLLVAVHGLRLSDPPTAELWANLAEVQAQRSGDGMARATLLSDLGLVHAVAGDLEQAETQLTDAVAEWESTVGPDHPLYAQTLANLGAVLLQQGKDARARPVLEKTLTALEAVVGPDHPDLVGTLNNLAQLDEDAGDHARARLRLQRAIRLARAAAGDRHPDLLPLLRNLAGLEEAAGDRAQQTKWLEQALQVARATLPADDPQIADLQRSLAGDATP